MFGFKALRNTASAATLVALSSCSTLGSMLPDGLMDTLSQVTELSGAVGEWKSQLDGVLNIPALDQLKDFVGQAGTLGDTLGGFKDQITGAAADPFGALAGGVSEMPSFDVSPLSSLTEGAKMAAVDTFADTTENVGKMAADFISSFGG